MSITAQEAADARFSESRRGFDANEVEQFRSRVVAVLKHYESELTRLGQSLKSAQKQSQELADAEEAVKRTFIAAAQAKREMLEEAEAEATRLVSEATASSAAAISDADANARATTEEAESTAHRVMSEAESTAAELVAAAQERADEAQRKTQEEITRMDRRLAQLRTAVGDIEERLRTFAQGSLGDIGVMRDLIDIETTTLEHMEPFQAAVDDLRGGEPQETEVAAAASDDDAADAGPISENIEAREEPQDTELEAVISEEVADEETAAVGGEMASSNIVEIPPAEWDRPVEGTEETPAGIAVSSPSEAEPSGGEGVSPIEAKLAAAEASEAPEQGESIIIDMTGDEPEVEESEPEDDGVDEAARLRARGQVLTGENEPSFYERRLAGLRERLHPTED